MASFKIKLIFFILLPMAPNLFAQNKIDLQGHRGCRGLMPENTIPGFVKAMEIGVTTLEMDLAISKDLQVVVSHEPYFSSVISTGPNNSPITTKTEKTHNLFQLDYQQIQQYDVGLKPHPNFPGQQKIPVTKPLLKDVVAKTDSFARAHQINLPQLNLEIKRQPKWDGTFHPPVQEFVDLVLDQVNTLGITPRTCIQSFDPETLQIIKKQAPEITLALLIENILSIRTNIKKLGFQPAIYSPYHKWVTKRTVRYCKEHGILLIPWTVNNPKDILAMIDLGVDGIITDYPDRVKLALEQNNLEVK